jgi:hypothetical protein
MGVVEMTFEQAVQAYLENPDEETWDELAHKIIPGTMRTVWQSWIRVDGAAPKELTSLGTGVRIWPTLPDPFTVRRAIREARQGRVPVGWWWLKEKGPPKIQKTVETERSRARAGSRLADQILAHLTRSQKPLQKLRKRLEAHSFHYSPLRVQFSWKKPAPQSGAQVVAIKYIGKGDMDEAYYLMEFWRKEGRHLAPVASSEHAIDEASLKETFEEETGLKL